MISRYLALPLAAIILAGAGPAQAGGDTNNTDDKIQTAIGKQVYATQCASCHGKDLEGQANWRQRTPSGKLSAPPHDASGHTWHHDDATLFAITKQGLAELTGKPYETDMPVFKDILSDAEIRAVLAYIKSRWPEKIRKQSAAINRRAGSR